MPCLLTGVFLCMVHNEMTPKWDNPRAFIPSRLSRKMGRNNSSHLGFAVFLLPRARFPYTLALVWSNKGDGLLSRSAACVIPMYGQTSVGEAVNFGIKRHIELAFQENQALS